MKIYGSVCSGIEAPTVAWHPLGWRPVFFAEIDKFARAVLAERYPDVALHGDFTTMQTGDYGPIDVLVGGTPCQDFSVAGLRAGLAGDRGNLTLEFVRLAGRLRPRWLVWENVPGVLSIDDGRVFGAFLGGLGKCGYGFAYRILDAQHFGVPQRRRRVFVIGYLGDWRPAAAVLFEPESLRGDSPPCREAGQKVAGAIARCSFDGGAGGRPEGGAANHFIAAPISPPVTSNPYGDHVSREVLLVSAYRTSGNSGAWSTGDCVDTLDQNTDRSGRLIAFGIDSDCFDRSGEGAASTPGQRSGLGIQTELSSALRSKRPNAVAFGGNNTAGPVDIATACNAHGGPHGRLDFESETFVTHALRVDGFDASEDGTGRGMPLVAAFEPRLRGDDGRGYGRPPHFSAESPSLNTVKTPAIVGPMSVRRLTPLECERLQGFPDNYTAIIYRGKPAADGPRYRAIGNSMAVPVMRWIGERISFVEALLAERGSAAA